MKELISLHSKRLLCQKFFYFFLFAFSFATFAYAFLLSTPELYSMLNVDANSMGGARFPEYMIRFYSANVGALFMSFITAIYINEEIQSGMFAQPLLHSKTRLDVLNTKVVTLCTVSFLMMLSIFFITYTISFFRWGNIVFTMPVFGQILEKYILIGFSLISLEMGTILLALYVKNTIVTVGVTLGFLMIHLLLNENVPQIAAFSFNYYPYSWLFDYEFIAIPTTSAFVGSILALVYFVLFYILARKKAIKIDFSR